MKVVQLQLSGCYITLLNSYQNVNFSLQKVVSNVIPRKKTTIQDFMNKNLNKLEKRMHKNIRYNSTLFHDQIRMFSYVCSINSSKPVIIALVMQYYSNFTLNAVLVS